MLEKRPLVPLRVRHTPSTGFSWVDRRFVRDFAPALSREAILLYFFLAAVSDKDGLSYWGDVKTSGRLKLAVDDVVAAREELVHHGLVAHGASLTQVLSLPASVRGLA